MALSCKQGELRFGCSSLRGQATGVVLRKGPFESRRIGKRETSRLRPFSLFQALDRQWEPCFLWDLLQWQVERLFESLNPSAASSPSSCQLRSPRASRATLQHTAGWRGTSEAPAPRRASATLHTDLPPPASVLGKLLSSPARWHLEDVTSSQQQGWNWGPATSSQQTKSGWSRDPWLKFTFLTWDQVRFNSSVFSCLCQGSLTRSYQSIRAGSEPIQVRQNLSLGLPCCMSVV